MIGFGTPTMTSLIFVKIVCILFFIYISRMYFLPFYCFSTYVYKREILK